jgi:threonyl-tRNA synthetase
MTQIRVKGNTTPLELLKEHKVKDAIGVSVNGKPYDWRLPVKEGDLIQFWTFEDPEGKEIFWHTSAHVLAQALLRLYPQSLPTIGPPIENGFYYDFANLKLSDADFDAIEAMVRQVVAENFRVERELFSSREEAVAQFANNPYKVELIESLPIGEPLTGYRQGEFFDLCRGPHMPSIGKIGAFKIMKTAGAYWRGDQKREMLTRIYAISFPKKEMLETYLTQLEEARRRDHKVVGPQLDLFTLHEEAPGLPFIHPKGLVIWNKLIDAWRDFHRRAGYTEIKTPQMLTKELWERSGHWANYRQNMYTTTVEEREMAIKPMNCPGCMLYYRTHVHSYRELPMRVAELGLVHRYEASGALSGLFRVRGFHQDDAHIFMTLDQIEEEVLGVLRLSERIYTLFGLEYRLELSTRPEANTIGSDADWERATESLRMALERSGQPYRINPGDGAFYGPKIDIHLRDALGRSWQCGTIQLDFALPERFELEYVERDGSRQRPVMIHRTIFGSMERFLGSLIEHFNGKFPLWCSPRQVALLPVADRHIPTCDAIRTRLFDDNFEVETDAAAESLNKKIRNAQLHQFNYIAVVGDREVEEGTVTVRSRDNRVLGAMSVDKFLEQLQAERASRSLSGTVSA